MVSPLQLNSQRLFNPEPTIRKIAIELYDSIKNLPIISPHGHTDPAWFANDKPFSNPAELLIKPDHYVFRMLYSQGIRLESLGIGNSRQAQMVEPEAVWRIFAENYYLFRGTPSRLWMDYVFSEIFEIDVALNASTAAHYYQVIDDSLSKANFRPRALFERFNIEVIATTENPLDELQHHKKIASSDWSGKVVTAFRPDNVLDPEQLDFAKQVEKLIEISGEKTINYQGYIKSLQNRREYFKKHGATSTDHGHLTPFTVNLSDTKAAQLFDKAMLGEINDEESELFRGHMLMKMADMSVDDGLVMQIHPGCYRNHNKEVLSDFGRDKGADLPMPTEYVKNLKALMDKHGNNPALQIILFTLDETTYSRELAPLAGHYPSLKLGPAWWFHDSPEGMKRFRQQTMETAGFYNTVGFNDDTRAFMSIPARHDVARRVDAGFLAELVADHRLSLEEAYEVAKDLTYNLAKKAYKL